MSPPLLHPPPPRVWRSAGVGADKTQAKERNRSLTGRRVPTLRQEKSSHFQASGAPPRAHGPPLALFRSHRLGISVAAAWLPEAAPGRAERRESARQPEQAAGWAHLGRAQRSPRS